MRARLARRVAHLIGFHTPECLHTADPRVSARRWRYPECQRTRVLAHVPRGLRWLGWHRWVAR